jgi:hypothetical protein
MEPNRAEDTSHTRDAAVPLAAEYVDRVLALATNLADAFGQQAGTGWLLLGITATQNLDRRSDALTAARTLAAASDRLALLDLVVERIRATVCENPGLAASPRAAAAVQAIESAVTAALLADTLPRPAYQTLVAPLAPLRTPAWTS